VKRRLLSNYPFFNVFLNYFTFSTDSWDRAGIDFMQWFKWKQFDDVYFISREKENMDLMMMAELPFDKKDPINTGVLSYDYVGTSAGVAMHRVRYQCPISGNKYNFVTSLPYISPGLIAFLYKTRWDIEIDHTDYIYKIDSCRTVSSLTFSLSESCGFVCRKQPHTHLMYQ
jgi:hypothetical protein